MTLEEIVCAYIRYHRPAARKNAEFYKGLGALSDAISRGAQGAWPNSRKHPHQFRLPSSVIQHATLELTHAQSQVYASRCFAELLRVVQKICGPIRGAGPLYEYDTALRIGYFLRLSPDLIYLHSGTRKGARALARRDYAVDWKADTLELTKLPKEFHLLEPEEVEDCLCIYASAIENPDVVMEHKPGPNGCSATAFLNGRRC